jgi:hypothetical protein
VQATETEFKIAYVKKDPNELIGQAFFRKLKWIMPTPSSMKPYIGKTLIFSQKQFQYWIYDFETKDRKSSYEFRDHFHLKVEGWKDETCGLYLLCIRSWVFGQNSHFMDTESQEIFQHYVVGEDPNVWKHTLRKKLKKFHGIISRHSQVAKQGIGNDLY